MLHQFAKNNDQDANDDPDGDGLTNLQKYLGGTDPRDFNNGALPVISLVSGNAQEPAPGLVLPQALVVEIRKKSNNDVLANAPLTFKVAVGGGDIVLDSGDTTREVSLLTDSAGRAQVWFRQPAKARVGCRITVTAHSGKRPVQAEFRVKTQGPGGGGLGDPGGEDPADDPEGDWDEDGLTNGEEMEIGSDPQNAQSADALIDIGPGTINAINGKGEAVGMVPPAEGTPDHPTAFFWSQGQRTTLQGQKPQPLAINDSGAIVGIAEFPIPDFPARKVFSARRA